MTGAQAFLAAYLIAANIFSFALFAVDKRRARLRMWRIRESALLTAAALGGSMGALLAMHLLRHKSRHMRFFLAVPALLFIHVFLSAYLFWRFS